MGDLNCWGDAPGCYETAPLALPRGRSRRSTLRLSLIPISYIISTVRGPRAAVSNFRISNFEFRFPCASADSRSAKGRIRRGEPLTSEKRERSAFTLFELLVVMGIIGVLLVFLAPAFTTIKSAGDVSKAAYTIKGVLDQARTYAKENNTYT